MSEILDILNFEIDESMLQPAVTIDDVFYIKDLKQRKLYINDEINDNSVSPIIRHILQYNCDDKNIPVAERKPILLYISSIGGTPTAGFQLIDVISQSKTKIIAVNLGIWYSMALPIGLSADVRVGTKNSSYLIHDGSGDIRNSGSKIRDFLEFNEQTETRIKNLIVSRTNISSEEYDNSLRKEWYFYSDVAKKLGVITHILGEDIELDEII